MFSRGTKTIDIEWTRRNCVRWPLQIKTPLQGCVQPPGAQLKGRIKPVYTNVAAIRNGGSAFAVVEQWGAACSWQSARQPHALSWQAA